MIKKIFLTRVPKFGILEFWNTSDIKNQLISKNFDYINNF